MKRRQNDFDVDYRFNVWAGSAVKLIKFKDDREKVRRELIDHMIDARDAYREAGFDPYEADTKAIENMGDPNLIANELSKLYRPFWGRLWKITQTLAVLAIIYIVTSLHYMLTETNIFYDYNEYFEPMYENASERIVADISSLDKVKINGYTITIPRAIVVEHEYDDKKTVWFTMQLDNINPYLGNPRIKEEIYARDDKGKVFEPRIMYANDYEDDLAGNPVRVSPFRTYYEMWLSGLDSDVKEVTFYYDRFGLSFEINLPLVNGGDENA
ncbi:MAG: hypothetical protein E7432_04935 [Ruminococcaceae bacterium]|nr:hypothetical protein [Oscillospiraceae bacterium]